VVVALAAFHGRAEPDGAGRIHAVEHLVDAGLFRLAAGLDVRGRRAVEAGGDAGRLIRLGEQIAGDLLEREPVERHVGVQGPNDPIAIGPDFAEVVALETVRIGIAGQVEPGASPALAELGRIQQLIY